MPKMQDRNESLSCFMDGELSDCKHLLDRLSHCDESKAFWLRYHLIREALRDSRPAGLSTDFSNRVMQALEREPAILSPRLSRLGPAMRRHWRKSVEGMAIAASVAVITVIAVKGYYLPSTDTAASSPTVAANTARPDVTPSPELSLPDRVPNNDIRPASADASGGGQSLNPYVLGHIEQSTSGHVQGAMPYVRLTGFEDGQ